MSHINGKAIFRKLGMATILSVYVLILVGGIVRSTGAGMGCPDWPKCFGRWIPPTQIAELPANYKEVYATKRKEKNTRLAVYLEKMGYSELSNQLLKDKSLYVEEDFNALKTWIEYINRLVGVVIGLLIFSTFLASFSYLKSKPLLFYLSLFSLVLVAFQGWIGSVVVSTNLLPGIITLHMLLALALVFSLTLALVNEREQHLDKGIAAFKNRWIALSVFALGITLIQVVAGTQVREAVDVVARLTSENNRSHWIDQLGMVFYFHRSFSWALLLLQGALVYFLYLSSADKKNQVLRINLFVFCLILLEGAMGAGLAYAGMPAFLQPLHLLFANGIAGLQFLSVVYFFHSSGVLPETIKKKQLAV